MTILIKIIMAWAVVVAVLGLLWLMLPRLRGSATAPQPSDLRLSWRSGLRRLSQGRSLFGDPALAYSNPR